MKDFGPKASCLKGEVISGGIKSVFDHFPFSYWDERIRLIMESRYHTHFLYRSDISNVALAAIKEVRW